jgi:lipopolysaccharide/colanic/teichoic acid biosynthesis glycosyltransferase
LILTVRRFPLESGAEYRRWVSSRIIPSGVHLIGVHDAHAVPLDDVGRQLPAWLRTVVAGAIAAVIAGVLLGFAADGAGAPGIVGGALAIGIMTAAMAGDARGREVVVSAEWLRNHVIRRGSTVGLTAMGLAVSGDLAGWAFPPLSALLVTAIAQGFGWSAAALVGRAAEPPRVLVVGSGVVARHVAASMSRSRRVRIVGHVDDGRLPRRPESDAWPLLGDVTDIGLVIANHDVDLVVFTFVGAPEEDLVAAVAACRARGVTVAVVSRMFEALDGGMSAGRIEGFPVITLSARSSRRFDAVVSRCSDIVLATVLMVLTAPLWLVLAAAVAAESRGGVFYFADRVGRDGVRFRMLKFRKMKADATGPALTMADDDRFTRMGRFLAHTKLDELPQLWNVLRGEMAMVGPRPEDARYVAAYEEAFRKVLSVRPGMTGLSQIGFRREFEHFVGPDFEEHYLTELLPWKIAVDGYYADHRSWTGDMRIMLWTARALLRGGEIDVDHLAAHVAFRPARGSSARSS